MIERLLAAFADGADDSGPRPGVGAEEIADILWLAARVDPAGARRSGASDAEPPDRQQPPPAPPSPSPEAGPVPGPGGPDGGEPAVQLFPAALPDPAGKPVDAAGGRRGSALRLPRAASLDDPLALMRSLRPVGRRSIGGPGEELDEQLTVERSIERMVPTPVLRPAESRWLDLALVVDTHHSMLLWSDHVDELRRVLTRSGVFRDVRTWQLTGTGPGATPMLTRGRGGPPRNPLELADPAGRRLILVLSDTVAGGWRQAPVQGVLRQWCAHNAVAVLNVLPERLWTRGAVRPVPFAVRADRPAAATRSWQQVPAVRRARGGRRAAAAVVPVVGVASGSLARLVRVVSGDGRWRRLACLRLDAEPGAASAVDDPAPGGGRSALEVVEQFRASASPTAQQLAAHLAAVPLTLPVMTLVRRSLLRDSEHGHLAEVALGGLFAPWGAEQDAEHAEFEFLPGVRDALLGSQLRGDVAAVRELVRRRVWEFMSRNRGTGPDFSAVRVAAGREEGPEGRRRVAEEALPFAVSRPPQDPGLRERVVRVRYDAMPEPQEVGTLLTPRLVLTVGDAALAPSTVAWVRAGDREVSCRAVWWDDALPRVFLLLADEDLADPAAWPQPLPWAETDAGRARVRVDGRTDRGEAVALTGEVAPYDGARNGELLRLSAEPESWTHFRGGPVSHDGELLGVVHGVWPDRMVFLSGRALAEQPGFREAMTTHARAGSAGASGAGASGAGDPGTAVSLVVGLRSRGLPLVPESMDGDLIPYTAGPAMSVVLRDVLRGAGAAGQVREISSELQLVVVDAPGALGAAGRILAELTRRAPDITASQEPWTMGLTVAVSDWEEALQDEGVRRVAAVTALYPGQGEAVPGPLLVLLSDPLHRQLGEQLGPGALRTFTRPGSGRDGWRYTGDPAELAVALTETDELRGAGLGWPACGLGASQADPVGCLGIRIAGHDRCLAHLGREEQRAHLATLGPGSPVDLRGTTFEHGLLQEVLEAVRDPGSRRVMLGPADFDRAVFVDDWNTVDADFSARASFSRAVFEGRANFVRTTMAGRASFRGAAFHGVAVFDLSSFHRATTFGRTVFRSSAEFTDTDFREGVSFGRAVLEDSVDLDGMRVTGTTDFSRTFFSGGPARLSGAVFAGAVSFSSATWERGLVSRGAVFDGPADFAHAVFKGEARFEGVRFAVHADADANALPPFTDQPERWAVQRRRDGTWDIRLIGTEEG
ncbi:SAV_2336 N-terminal domain-related protein [Streptomyces sp. NPDC020858]|uniref:SAV_2336 N-terminal domain-related protein n=1 Tax=Streptomyces sp. NPDC020858 TaxID=3365097 RepID=UPI0037A11210